MAHLMAIFSLSCGAIIDLGVCRYAGKGQGELSVFRQLMHFFRSGDVVLADSMYCSWRDLFTLKECGVDSVTQLQVKRKTDFRKGVRLGKGDHVVKWTKPTSMRLIDRPAYRALSDSIAVRKYRVTIGLSGFRSKTIAFEKNELDCPIDAKDLKARLVALFRKGKSDLGERGRTPSISPWLFCCGGCYLPARDSPFHRRRKSVAPIGRQSSTRLTSPEGRHTPSGLKVFGRDAQYRHQLCAAFSDGPDRS